MTASGRNRTSVTIGVSASRTVSGRSGVSVTVGTPEAIVGSRIIAESRGIGVSETRLAVGVEESEGPAWLLRIKVLADDEYVDDAIAISGTKLEDDVAGVGEDAGEDITSAFQGLPRPRIWVERRVYGPLIDGDVASETVYEPPFQAPVLKRRT